MSISFSIFSEDTIQHIGKMREKFFATGSADGITGVRPEILECWNIAYQAGLQISSNQKPFVSKEELAIHIQRNQMLLDVAMPYMNALDRIIGENFAISLLSNTGIVLSMIGSQRLRDEMHETGLFVGSDRRLNHNAYTSIFLSCLRHHEPCQMIATEHSSSVDDKWAGVAAPVLSEDRKTLMGMIGINGYWWNAHSHTMGLAIMMAEAIARHLSLKISNQELSLANTRLATTIEAFDSGIIYFSDAGHIRHINSTAMQYINLPNIPGKQYTNENIFTALSKKMDINVLKSNLIQKGMFECEFATGKNQKAIWATFKRLNPSGKMGDSEYFAHLRLSSDVHKLANQIVGSRAIFTFDSIMGKSKAIVDAKRNARLAAEHNSAVLICGESGTGKELFAQAIHNASDRAKGPFIALNCGAIPKSLIESELFGYEPGSFTGAQKKGQAGKLELADGGTLFLDEIGDMPYELQVTLLRVLQNREVTRLGGASAKKIDIMVIAATNQDLEESINNRTFRSDLYFRLNVLTINLPALRERSSDIIYLANYFLEKYRGAMKKEVVGFSSEAETCMKCYSWPGNIRELENAVERAVIVCSSATISITDLPDKVVNRIVPSPMPTRDLYSGYTAPSEESAASKERHLILETLQKSGGNLSETALALGISRPTLYRRLKHYNIRPKQQKFE